MNAFKKILIGFAIAMTVITGVPMVGLAETVPEQRQSGYKVILSCEDGDVIPGSNGEHKCTFTDFMRQIDHLISLLLYIAVLLAIISFVYAGFKLIFSGGNEEALKHAKHIFWNVVVGLVLAYGAWIIVHFITTTVGLDDDYTLLQK